MKPGEGGQVWPGRALGSKVEGEVAKRGLSKLLSRGRKRKAKVQLDDGENGSGVVEELDCGTKRTAFRGEGKKQKKGRVSQGKRGT